MNVYLTEEYRKKVLLDKKPRGYIDRDKFAFKNGKGHILELGCGERPIFHDSVKVDIYPMPNCICADCNKPLPLKTKFDTIIALDLIEHLSNVKCFLKECHRLLKKDGNLILSTPNVLYWKNRIRFLFGDNDFSDNGLHLQFYTPESLTKELEKNGFVVKEIKPIGLVNILELCGGFVVKSKKI